MGKLSKIANTVGIIFASFLAILIIKMLIENSEKHLEGDEGGITIQERDDCDITNLNWINKGYPDGKHGNYNPKDRMKDLVKEFGCPDYIDPKSGGYAIWGKNNLSRNPNNVWNMILILDEQIPHEKPGPHVDFLYSWYSLEVPADKIDGG